MSRKAPFIGSVCPHHVVQRGNRGRETFFSVSLRRGLLPPDPAPAARDALAAAGKCLRMALFSSIAALTLAANAARAAHEEAILGKIQAPLEQTLGQGRTVLWTMADVATQYQPAQPTPAMQAALRAQQEGRFLDALIGLEEADKGQANQDARAEMALLRASFLLQGHQSGQAREILPPLLAAPRYAADTHALIAMASLQQGLAQQALEEAQRARDEGASKGNGLLPHLALSYALQGAGRLPEARDAIHQFNSREPRQAIALAREAELALTLDETAEARTLVRQAQALDAAHPYVVSVAGLVYLIDGHAEEAKAAFETALKRDPADAKALLGLALADIKLGNREAGQKKLLAANEAAPGNALILTYLGRAQMQSGQTDAALASWRSARQADPKDPTPWLYQAQAELQANRPLDAQQSLREAQARTAYRAVYRGERLLREDEQLLQANLAETQRRMGMEGIAFHTLADSPGEKSAATLRNQADLLQGRRFGESARRSLLLQSMFNERPGNLPAALDVYGDGAGQTGASTPQHGAVSGLSPQQASYNNYDELFGGRVNVEADAVGGSKNTEGEQLRLGVGNGTLGLALAGLQFRSDGFAPFEDLDNRVGQATVQWRPSPSTQAFVSRQIFRSQRGEIFFPADFLLGAKAAIEDNSRVTRLGVRQSLGADSELRALWSEQQTDQTIGFEDFTPPTWGGPFTWSQSGTSSTHDAELQYRRSGGDHAMQWGLQQTRGQLTYQGAIVDKTLTGRQVYAAWQQRLSPSWQLDAGLGWGRMEVQDNTGMGNGTSLERWLPRFGLVYGSHGGTHARLAAWRGMGIPGAGDATLAPVGLAGVLLARPLDSGKLVEGVSLGGDMHLNPSWWLEGQTQRRKTDQPTIGQEGQDLLRQHVDESRAAGHWQPQGKPWLVSLAYDHERLRNDPETTELDSLDEQRLRAQQLALRWFASAHWTVNLAWSHNRVAGTQKSRDPATFDPLLLAYRDSFNQLDADLSWQFAASGSLTAGVRNAADTRFQYVDIDWLNPRFSNGRLLYAKLKLAW